MWDSDGATPKPRSAAAETGFQLRSRRALKLNVLQGYASPPRLAAALPKTRLSGCENAPAKVRDAFGNNLGH